MNHKRRTLAGLAVVAVIALAAVASAVFNREPSYGGKTLSAWLRIYEEHGDGDLEGQQAEDAVRHIGTSALPLLTRRLSYKPPQWKERPNRHVWKFVSSPAGYPFRWLWRDSGGTRAEQAVRAFEILGEEASPQSRP